jgi:hypothetical protein
MGTDYYCEHCEEHLPDGAEGVRLRCTSCGKETTPVSIPVVAEADDPAPALAPIVFKASDGEPAGSGPPRQAVLRGAVLLLGVTGALYCILLGCLWLYFLDSARQSALRDEPVPLPEGILPLPIRGGVPLWPVAAHTLFACAALGLVGAALGCLRRRFAGAPLLLVAGITPLVFFPPALLFTVFLAAAAALSLFVLPAGATARKPKWKFAGLAVYILTAIGAPAYFGLAVCAAALLFHAGMVADQFARETADLTQPPRGEKPFAAILDEVEQAGAGMKLIRLDLAPAYDLTIDVPEGSAVKGQLWDLTVIEGPRFLIAVGRGRRGLIIARDPGFLGSRQFLVNDTNVVVTPPGFNGDTWGFVLANVLGHQDFAVQSMGAPREGIRFSRAECMLMLKCARTLSLKRPPPDDPQAALEMFRKRGDGKDDPKTTFRFNELATDATLALIQNDRGIRELDLSATCVTGDGLPRLKGLDRLESLDLGTIPLDDAGLARLAPVTGLKRLKIAGYHGELMGPGLSHLARLKRLSELVIGGFALNDMTLSHLQRVDSLESLTVVSGKIAGPGLAALKRLPRLRSLNLKGLMIDDDGAAYIAALTNLEALDLGGSAVGDAGAAHLAKLTRLRKLDLSRTRVTEKGVALFDGHRGLVELDYSGTAGAHHKRPK